MTIFRCPENYSDDEFLNNRSKIKQLFLRKTKSQKSIIKFFKKINNSVKDFFRNFSTIIQIFFVKKSKNVVYIAVVCYGGFGDIIRYKAVLLELVKMYPDIVIDVYNKTAQSLFQDIKNIRFYLNIDAVNFIKKRYDIVYKFDCFTTQPLFIENGSKLADRLLNNLTVYKNKYPFCFNISHIYGNDDFLNNNINIINLLKITSGVDNVEDDCFTIKTQKVLLSEFGIDESTMYLTFQCGAGSSGDLNNVKCWSIDNWDKLLVILREKLNNKIKFVQVGTGGHYLHGIDINLSGKTSLDELFLILQQSLLHVDIDGACSHFAKAVGTKSLIIFGPTDGYFSGYHENINVLSSLCGGCWTKGIKCPLGHEKILCMESIIPEFVADKIIEYIEFPENNKNMKNFV